MEQTHDSSDILDDILCRWHHWASSAQFVRGFAPRSLVVGDFKVSRQYDDENGALDGDIEKQIMRTVDFCVVSMMDPHKAAIYANARALVVGCAVFSSPRLPQDRAERMAVIAEARSMLTRRLCDAGVL